MESIIIYALFAVGIVFIVKGGDWFVDGAAWVAEVTGIPKFVVGATIVSVATTLPEIFVSSTAAAEGHAILMSSVGDFVFQAHEKIGLAIGNGIGSVICNTAMIMALSLVFMPVEINHRKFTPKALHLGLALAALMILTRTGSLSTRASIVLLVVFVSYIIENVKSAKSDSLDDEEPPVVDKKTIIRNVLSIAVGAVGIVVGSRLLVDYGSDIARSWGVSESIIGLTMVAIGTSLPELVTAVSAIIKKQPSMSVGNVIGANIIDTVLILPVCSLIYGGQLPVSLQNLYLDFPVAVLVSAVALIPAIIGKKFYRWQGIVLLAVYATYLVIVSTGLEWYLSLFNI
ncbi:MAG: calcium/sodium antiporter [Clostridia bacterium]|nr:calcium/sodium antiporter [Clostridia bacterium]